MGRGAGGPDEWWAGRRGGGGGGRGGGLGAQAGVEAVGRLVVRVGWWFPRGGGVRVATPDAHMEGALLWLGLTWPDGVPFGSATHRHGTPLG